VTDSSLNSLLRPRSIAVIGVSREPSKWGYKVFHNIVSNAYKGEVYPVNPSMSDIDGIKCYARVGDIPADVDLAIIIVPAPVALAVIDECGAKKVKALCVITAGFSEVGPEGAALEEKLKQKAASYGMRMMGPNTMGFVNNTISLNASIVPRMPRRGRYPLLPRAARSGCL